MREWISRAPRGRSRRQGRRARKSLVQGTTCSTCSCTCWLYNTPWSIHPWGLAGQGTGQGSGTAALQKLSRRASGYKKIKEPILVAGWDLWIPPSGRRLTEGCCSHSNGKEAGELGFHAPLSPVWCGHLTARCCCLSNRDCFPLRFFSLNMEAAEFTRTTAEEETTWTLGFWRSSRPPRFGRGDLDWYSISAFRCFQCVARTNSRTFM